MKFESSFSCLVGQCSREVSASSRSDRRRAAHEKVHVGSVLVSSPEVFQVPLYSLKGEEGGAIGSGRNQEWQSKLIKADF